MNDYQMWSEQPELWVIDFVISLALTLLLYGTFPIVFAKTRKGGITKKRYRGYCICASVAVYVLLMILYVVTGEEGVPGMFPAVFWTGVFYRAGLSTLGKRGKILAFMPQKTPQPVKGQEPASAPNETASAVQYDVRKPLAVTREAERPLEETTDARRGTGEGTVRFCRNCGCELVPGSQFCAMCGTKIVREW